MIITISGTPGAGKTVIGKALAKKLNYKFYSMGDIRGKLAKEKGMTIDEFNKLGETQAFTDNDVDNYQRELPKKEDNLVIEGRLSYNFIPSSVKLFFKADWNTAAKRILNDKVSDRSDEKKSKNIDGQIKVLQERVASDKKRYKKWYGLDFTDEKQFDFILDTSNENSIEKNTQRVLDWLKKKKLVK